MYEDIKPYDDLQTVEAMGRIASSPYVDKIAGYLYPGLDPQVLRDTLLSVSGVEDFQTRVMYGAVKSIIDKTTTEFTYSGLEHFEKGRGYLMLSTHRDIVLDPAFIQWVLKANNMPLTEIAAGDNLISTQLLEDLMRSNRMITVRRSRNPRDLYNASVELSAYIRERIHAENPASIWIAHRNGRTKDGKDATEQGLLKMISLSGSSDFAENIEELNIMPVAISYELESCDLLKATEVYMKRSTGEYHKKPGEDTQSILTGIMQPKGRVHISFCEPLTHEEIAQAASYEKNDRYRHLAETIDRKLKAGLRHWPINLAAAARLKGAPIEDPASAALLDKLLSRTDNEEISKVLLEIYSGPVMNA